MSTNTVEIFLSTENQGFIAQDPSRPGCVAFGISEEKSLKELVSARKAWDAANKRKAEGQ